MRPVEFREALTDQWGQFREFHYWGFSDNKSFIPPAYDNQAYSSQFTGVLYPNGRKIFEHDIVKAKSGEMYEIVFKHGAFKMKRGVILLPIARDLELIGTTWSTPELLQ